MFLAVFVAIISQQLLHFNQLFVVKYQNIVFCSNEL